MKGLTVAFGVSVELTLATLATSCTTVVVQVAIDRPTAESRFASVAHAVGNRHHERPHAADRAGTSNASVTDVEFEPPPSLALTPMPRRANAIQISAWFWPPINASSAARIASRPSRYVDSSLATSKLP